MIGQGCCTEFGMCAANIKWHASMYQRHPMARRSPFVHTLKSTVSRTLRCNMLSTPRLQTIAWPVARSRPLPKSPKPVLADLAIGLYLSSTIQKPPEHPQLRMQSPNNGRAKVTKTDDGVYIVIPSVKNRAVLGFLGFWMCGWLMGETFVTVALLGMLFTGSFSFATLFMLVWLCGWTVGGYVAGRELLWGVLGPAKITTTLRT